MFKDGEELLEELQRDLEDAEANIQDLEKELRYSYSSSKYSLGLAFELLVKAKVIEDKPIITEHDLHLALSRYDAGK